MSNTRGIRRSGGEDGLRLIRIAVVWPALGLLMLCLLSSSVLGGDNPRSVDAVRISIPPRIDGSLDEKEWMNVPPATDFIQRDPDEGQPASERTEIRVLYNDEALYFGCMFFDSEPGKILSRLTRRDNEIESDRASIRIDSYHDHQTCFEFTFNVAGVKVDILQYDDADREDESWDPVWEVETRILPWGWAAEVKIPFRILRYRQPVDPSEEVEFGINFIRYITRRQEGALWVFTPKSESGFISRFGHLGGLRMLPAPRQGEVLPFIVGKQAYEPATTTRGRLEKFSTEVGLDLRYNLTTNFILDATVNPDFGQVEADPAVLNLSTFETFYPEKRPFFIEGTQIIRFTTFGGDFGPGMFYSRRIGRAISETEVDVPAGGRIGEVPQQVTILGAVKLSGKTAGGLSLGMLQAFTEEESATVTDATGAMSAQVVEPFAHYNVLRLRQDVFANSNVGMILTSVSKEGRYPAFTAGCDWNLKLGEQAYALTGFLGLSKTTSADVARVGGAAGKIAFSRIAAEHWLWSLSYDFTSKRYDINDVGFFNRPNDFGWISRVDYKEDRPGAVLRNYRVGVWLHERRNFDGVNLNREVKLEGTALFANYWSVGVEAGSDAGMYDDRETRGFGLYRKPWSGTAALSLATDSREAVDVGMEQQFSWDEKKKFGISTELNIEMRPLSWMEWEINTEYDKIDRQEAWVGNIQSGMAVERIFADRTTESLSLTLRNTVTFTRDLTLQCYAQLFFAKGKFAGFRRLVGTDALSSYEYDTGVDFTDRSFTSNLVLRWEYIPGSTLYLVWSQARSGDEYGYGRSLHEDVREAFRLPPSNILLLKINYWWAI